YITKEGKWLTGESLLDFGNFKKENFQEAKEIFMTPVYNNYNLYANPEEVGLLGKKILGDVDVIFPAIHGTHGEDGSIQGLLGLMDIPYVGGSVLSSSVGMDKILMKDVFKANDLPIVDYYWFYRSN